MSAGLVNGHGICVAELGMHRVNPEHLDPEPFSDLATTDFLFREEPDEEEEDEDDGNRGDGGAAEEGEGYSE